jgi:YbbR domain-containing protein
MASKPVILPDQVQISGPAPLVERVNRIQATVLLANGTTSLREMRSLKALDEAGNEVAGVQLQPAQVQVSISIHQRVNARDAGIRVVTNGTPAPGYWLSGLSVTPSGVTLQGNPDRLAEIGSFVNTLPVEVSQAVGDLSLGIPLDLPADIQAIDSDGNLVKNVTVVAQVTARKGDLMVSRPVELLAIRSGITVTLNPPEVELLLSGPLPTLNQIESDPEMVRVLVEFDHLIAGQRIEATPTVIAPSGIQTQIVPPSVLIIGQ